MKVYVVEEYFEGMLDTYDLFFNIEDALTNARQRMEEHEEFEWEQVKNKNKWHATNACYSAIIDICEAEIN